MTTDAAPSNKHRERLALPRLDHNGRKESSSKLKRDKAKDGNKSKQSPLEMQVAAVCELKRISSKLIEEKIAKDLARDSEVDNEDQILVPEDAAWVSPENLTAITAEVTGGARHQEDHKEEDHKERAKALAEAMALAIAKKEEKSLTKRRGLPPPPSQTTRLGFPRLRHHAAELRKVEEADEERKPDPEGGRYSKPKPVLKPDPAGREDKLAKKKSLQKLERQKKKKKNDQVSVSSKAQTVKADNLAKQNPGDWDEKLAIPLSPPPPTTPGAMTLQPRVEVLTTPPTTPVLPVVETLNSSSLAVVQTPQPAGPSQTHPPKYSSAAKPLAPVPIKNRNPATKPFRAEAIKSASKWWSTPKEIIAVPSSDSWSTTTGQISSAASPTGPEPPMLSPVPAPEPSSSFASSNALSTHKHPKDDDVEDFDATETADIIPPPLNLLKKRSKIQDYAHRKRDEAKQGEKVDDGSVVILINKRDPAKAPVAATALRQPPPKPTVAAAAQKSALPLLSAPAVAAPSLQVPLVDAKPPMPVATRSAFMPVVVGRPAMSGVAAAASAAAGYAATKTPKPMIPSASLTKPAVELVNLSEVLPRVQVKKTQGGAPSAASSSGSSSSGSISYGSADYYFYTDEEDMPGSNTLSNISCEILDICGWMRETD